MVRWYKVGIGGLLQFATTVPRPAPDGHLIDTRRSTEFVRIALRTVESMNLVVVHIDKYLNHYISIVLFESYINRSPKYRRC